MEKNPIGDFGKAETYTTQFRQYNPVIGRWMSLDPLKARFPYFSPYIGFDNNPIYFIDPSGAASEDPDPKGGTVFFFQYEGRASLIFTGSTAIGIMVDTHGNVGLYNTSTFGLGLIAGGSTGWSGGFITSDYIYETEGWGSAWGVLATASALVGVTGAIEYNNAYEWDDGLKDADFGTTIGVPIQIGAVGLQAGGYGEGSYTTIIASGNVVDMVEEMFNEIEKEFDITLTEEEKKEYRDFVNENVQVDEIENDQCEVQSDCD